MIKLVRLTRTIELAVKGDSEEAIQDWLNSTTPEEAKEQAIGEYEESFSEEIVKNLSDKVVPSIII